jgi:hypothetical protein
MIYGYSDRSDSTLIELGPRQHDALTCLRIYRILVTSLAHMFRAHRVPSEPAMAVLSVEVQAQLIAGSSGSSPN